MNVAALTVNPHGASRNPHAEQEVEDEESKLGAL